MLCRYYPPIVLRIRYALPGTALLLCYVFTTRSAVLAYRATHALCGVLCSAKSNTRNLLFSSFRSRNAVFPFHFGVEEWVVREHEGGAGARCVAAMDIPRLGCHLW
eukprot:1619947-Rhodomonas_salina.1